MFCPKCGSKNADNSRFCAACGASFNSITKKQPYPLKINPKLIIAATVIFTVIGLLSVYRTDITTAWKDFNRPLLSSVIPKYVFDLGNLKWRSQPNELINFSGGYLIEETETSQQYAVNCKGRKLCSIPLSGTAKYFFSNHERGLCGITIDVFDISLKDINETLYEQTENKASLTVDQFNAFAKGMEIMRPVKAQAIAIRKQLTSDLQSIYGVPYKEDDINATTHSAHTEWKISEDTSLFLDYYDNPLNQRVSLEIFFTNR